LQRLLEYFTILHGLLEFNISGAVSVDLKVRVGDEVSENLKPMKEVLQELLASQDEGQNFRGSGQYKQATERHHAALEKLLSEIKAHSR